VSDTAYENEYTVWTNRSPYESGVLRSAHAVVCFVGPTISPYCQREGHKWSDPFFPLTLDAAVRACSRCARRGVVVLRTEAAWDEVGE
jgi:hypothetical protein